jgi:hypothetical protein
MTSKSSPITPPPEPLSPAAQAVLDAVVSHPSFATRKRIAAALRAAADQLSYKLPFEDDGRVDVSDLLAIATELENHQ